MPSFVTHLEAAIDGTRLEARTAQTLHDGRPLWVRYDLDAIRNAVDRNALQSRLASMWRYRELLPFEDESHIISLGETTTPLIHCQRLGKVLSLSNLWIKDESRLPTASFKARGMAMAVTMAHELGVTSVAVPTAGNAGGALAAYAARAGMQCTVLMPRDTPIVNQAEAALHGARCFLVDGLINDCGRMIRDGAKQFGWFDMSTLKEPYRIEGKKTMGLELADQLGWSLPDVILYPTGGGTGLIGMWKAFNELQQLGWLEQHGRSLPRMIACQSSGCAPIVDAFENGERFAQPPDHPHTIASGLRVPIAVGDFMILDAVRASRGRAVAADETQLQSWMQRAAALEGIDLCPESAACLDVADQGVKDGWLAHDEHIVLFNTGLAQKYIEVINADLKTITSIDEVR
ncbi:MAG: threonine synthase [Phycisphaerales bacterium]